MLFSTIGQIHAFWWMLGAGLLIGALYALCALVRRLLAAGFWLTLAADVFFGLGAGVILILAALTADYGRIRFFELLGAALGAILFELGLRPGIERALTAVFGRMGRIMKRISNFRLIKVIFR